MFAVLVVWIFWKVITGLLYVTSICHFEIQPILIFGTLLLFLNVKEYSLILQENIDNLLLNLTSKLKSKSRAPVSFMFHHDCFNRYLFGDRGSKSRDGKAIMLNKEDFLRCNFFIGWDQSLDRNGDGVMIKFSCAGYINFIQFFKHHDFQGSQVIKTTTDANWKTESWLYQGGIFMCFIIHSYLKKTLPNFFFWGC